MFNNFCEVVNNGNNMDHHNSSEEDDDKHNFYKKPFRACTNCSKIGHDYKHCREPTTSWGIILVKLCDIKVQHGKYSVKHNESGFNNLDGISIRTKNELKNIGYNADSIRFLMVSRKHSLGYVEFIRGRYKPENIEGIIFMFQQMMPKEILKIGKKNFDALWDDFWLDDIKKQFYKREYTESKGKFDQLKNKTGVELSLDFYVQNVKSHYDAPEWGFPKGRKTKGEGDIECAIREFCEETNMSKDDIKIVQNIKPIVEDITGTNGIKYRHIYYLAEAVTDTKPEIDSHNKTQSSEIGDINYFTYDEANSVIREYHIEKKKILTNIYLYYFDLLVHEQTESDNSIQNDFNGCGDWKAEERDVLPE